MVSGSDDLAAPPGSTGSARRRPGRIRLFALAALGGLVAVLAYVVVADPLADEESTAPATVPPVPTTVPSIGAPEIYQTLLPSLVFIGTDEANPETGGLGSGVVVNERGHVMTAHHVVADASVVEVTFSDGTTTRASIIEADPEIDIALLEPEQLPELVVPAVLGGGVVIGDEVYPLGNPLGFTGSITAGVVSGLERSILREDGQGRLEGMIQFDAAVNPGSSGGPLVNRDGQVVGIVTALANPTDQRTFIGLGFAVPISTAGGVAGQIDR